MIEVLASLIIIGVGMLGLASLQIAAAKSANNAHSRNVASLLAMDLSDRMRANKQGVIGDFYANNVVCATGLSVSAQCNSDTEYCTPEETARFDIEEVMCGVKNDVGREGGVENLLVSGTLLVESNTGCDDITDTNKHRITIGWSSAKIISDQPDSDTFQTLQVCVNP